MRKKITALILIFASILCMTGVTKSVRASTAIYINQQYTGTLDAGEECVYELYIPSAGLYAVETTGGTDTYMTIEVENHTYIDDNSGMDNNAAIGFRTTGACWGTVCIQHANNDTGTGTFSVQARKQRAQIYTFQYADINTLGDSTVAKQKLNSMGYSTNVWEQKAASHILQTDDSQYTRLNSEVVFFSGHGYPGRARFYNGSQSSYLEALNLVNSRVKMTNTKVAVWLCCDGASAPSSGGYSMTTASVMMGAGAAVGWDRGIDTDAALYWANRFFTFMAAGFGVEEAAKEATLCDPETEKVSE